MEVDRHKATPLSGSSSGCVYFWQAPDGINAHEAVTDQAPKSMKLAGVIATLLVLSLVSLHCRATGLIGQGRAVTAIEAERIALADLALALQMAVQTGGITLSSEEKAKPAVKRVIETNSELPMLGVSMNVVARGHEFLATAALEAATALPLYETRLRNISKSVARVTKSVARTETMAQTYALLTDLLTQIDRYYRHKLVAILLDTQHVKNLEVSEVDIKARLARLNNSNDDLDLALQQMVQDIPREKQAAIFIHSPLTQYAHEITPFARMIKDWLSAQLRAERDPTQAHQIMEGEYEYIDRGILLTYRLQDNSYDTLKTEVAILSPEAYQGYRTEPTSADFGRQLYRGLVRVDLQPYDKVREQPSQSSEHVAPLAPATFRVSLRTDKGNRALSYRVGEKGRLFLKMSRTGFFYIVGHVTKPEQRYSYLLELQEAKGKRRFVSHLDVNRTNKWIDLGEFNIVPPVGVESLQVIASSTDTVAMLPPTRFNSRTGLYIIDDEPKQAMQKTRAIVLSAMKKGAEGETYAEAVLDFTTLPARSLSQATMQGD